MEQISFYLKKFENLEVKGDRLKKQIVGVVEKIAGIKINKENVLILKNGTIKISTIGPIKTTIFLNKTKIEKELNKKIF